MQNNKHVWITWERQTRNRSMANILKASYIEYGCKNGLLRYAVLSIKTIQFLFKNRPQIIYFQNPSVVLGLVCVFYRFFFGEARLIGDFHNCALDEMSPLFHVNTYIARRCTLVIVTNPALEVIVKKMGGNAFSFPDPLPHVAQVDHESSNQSKNIIFITSWASDEPINEVLSAYMTAGLNNDGVSLLVTGRPTFSRLEFVRQHYEAHGIKFLGFVDEEEYWMLLRSAYFVVDLTTRKNCMVCGAYEALAAHRVLLLSNNEASMEYFGDGVVYTDNKQFDIQKKLSFIHDHIVQLSGQVQKTVSSVLDKQSENALKIKYFIENKS